VISGVELNPKPYTPHTSESGEPADAAHGLPGQGRDLVPRIVWSGTPVRRSP